MTSSVDEISIRTTQAGSGAIENSFCLSVFLFVCLCLCLSRKKLQKRRTGVVNISNFATQYHWTSCPADLPSSKICSRLCSWSHYRGWTGWSGKLFLLRRSCTSIHHAVVTYVACFRFVSLHMQRFCFCQRESH